MKKKKRWRLRGSITGTLGSLLAEERIPESVPTRESRPFLLPWLAVAALLAALLWHSWYGPDIWSHLSLGREVLRTHSAQPLDDLILQQPHYLNIYWLFQLVVLGAHGLAGVSGVTVFFAAVWFLVLLLWGRTARLWGHPTLGLPLALVSVLVCQTRFEERPETLSWLFLAFHISVLSGSRPERASPRDPTGRLGGREMAALGVSQILWTNVHGYFFLGPAVAAVKLLALALTSFTSPLGAARRARNRLLLLIPILLACSLVSPFGIRTWRSVWELSGMLREMRFAIEELNPPVGPYLLVWTIWVFWLAWGATVLAVAWAVVRRRGEVFAVALAVTGLFLSATSLRNVPMVVILAGPLWAIALPAWSPRGPGVASRRAAAAATSLASLLLILWVVEGGFHRSLRSGARFGIEPYDHVYPARFLGYLRETGFSGTLFNHPRDGGFLEFHDPPPRLYADSRFSEPGPVREYFDALFFPKSFLALHARHRFDAVLLDLSTGQDALLQLLGLPDWRLAYADLHRAFLVNLRSPAGRSAPVRSPVFYSGQDLSVRQEGVSANRWAHALGRLGRADWLLLLLRQMAVARQVPSPVLQHALELGVRTGNAEILRAASALYPRMLALTVEDARAVEHLMKNDAVQRAVRTATPGP